MRSDRNKRTKVQYIDDVHEEGEERKLENYSGLDREGAVLVVGDFSARRR